MKKIGSSLLFALALSTSVIHASSLFYESFDYPAAVDGLGGRNGGTGFAGAYSNVANNVDVQSGSLGYTTGNYSLVTAGNKAYADGTTNLRPVSLFGATDVLYVSMIAQQTGLSGYANIQFQNSTGGDLFAFGRNSANSNWLAAFGNAQEAISSVAATTLAFLVMKVEINVDIGGVLSDRISLFINPDLASGEPGSPSASFSIAHSAARDLSNVAQFRIGTRSDNAMLFDELRGGTTWSDVVVAVPEPSTFAILTVAGLGVLVFTRRRANKAKFFR